MMKWKNVEQTPLIYVCVYCTECFSDAGTMRTHYRKHHTDEEYQSQYGEVEEVDTSDKTLFKIYDEQQPLMKDPDIRCKGCGATGFMELFQVEPDEYAWRCECGHEELEDHPEKVIN